MSGVEVLSSEMVKITDLGNGVWIGVACALIVGFIFMCIIDNPSSLFLSTFIFLMCLAGGVFDVQTGEYIKYKVTVSEEVSLSSFNDKYEIIDQEGKIYTVKEKDVE